MLSVPEYRVTYPSAICAGLHPISTPLSSAVTRMPVPLALSQLKLNTAASGFGAATTGGTREMSPSSPGTLILMTEIESSQLFSCGVPHENRITQRSAHGIHARSTVDGGRSEGRRGAALAPFGRHTRRKSASDPIEITADATSTSHGP